MGLFHDRAVFYILWCFESTPVEASIAVDVMLSLKVDGKLPW